MSTLTAVAILLVLGLMGRLFIHLPLYFVSMIGSFIAFTDKLGNKNILRLVLGTIISVILQSYLCLAYTAILVNWMLSITQEQGVNKVIWPIGFFILFFPIWSLLENGKKTIYGLEQATKSLSFDVQNILESHEKDFMTIQVRGLLVALILSIIGFIFFLFKSSTMHIIYWWIPYIGR